MEAHAKTHEHEKAEDRKFPCEQCDLKFKTSKKIIYINNYLAEFNFILISRTKCTSTHETQTWSWCC